MDQSEQEQQQFERVLSRLDALMKRGHAVSDVAAPMISQTTEPLPLEQDQSFEVMALEQSATQEAVQTPEIPVLTEIYEPATDAIPILQDALEEDADIEQAILDRWLPSLQAAIDEIVEEETRRFSEGLQQRLQQQVADALRQHIRRLKGQTEI